MRNVAAQRRPIPIAPRVSEAELEAHTQFVARMGDKAIWLDYR
jgi:DNA polymerase-3 subunit epsilon